MKRLISSIALCLVLLPSSMIAQTPQKPLDPAPLYPILEGGMIAPNTQTIAYGSIPAKLTSVSPASGGRPGERQYAWQMSVDGVNWVLAEENIAAIGLEYQPGLLREAKLYFRRMVVVVHQGSGSSSLPLPILDIETAYSNAVEINVTGILSGGSISLATPTVSLDATPPTINSSMPASGANGTIRYQWQESPDDVSWTNIGGASSIDYTVTALTPMSKTEYRRVATSGSGTLAQTAYSNTVSLTVELPAFKAVQGVVELSDVDDRTNDLKTYEKVAVLDGSELTSTPTYIERSFYYDYKGRVIQTVEKNHLGGISRYSTKYDFVSNVLASHESHKISATATADDEKLTTFTYDNRGRLLSETTTVNGSSPASMTYTYDELGKLKTQMVTGKPSTQETFTYNIQGWLTRKSGPYFDMKLSYFDPRSGSSKARYSGDIAEWKWKQSGQGLNSHEFTYDALGRVLSYDHVQSAGWDSNSSTPISKPFTEALTYDKNGNILTMQRKGTHMTSGATATDNLGYTYTGNKLTTLNHNNASGSAKATGSYAYTYDANGNMTKDARENLDYGYNFLNLLCEVKQGVTTKATYRWLADGTKAGVRSGVTGAQGFEYLGSLIYTRTSQGDLALESTSFGGGRIVKTSGGYEIHYHVTDHLGNVRAVHYDNTTSVTSNDYYAFGKRHNNSSLPIARGDQANRWQFNGKEKQLVGDVNFLDFGARMYNPEIGRFMNPDPFGEDRRGLTPFAYAANDPINLIDWMGLWPEDSDENKDERQRREEEERRKREEEERLKNQIIANMENTFSMERIGNEIAIEAVAVLAKAGKVAADILNPVGSIKAAGDKLEAGESLNACDVGGIALDLVGLFPGVALAKWANRVADAAKAADKVGDAVDAVSTGARSVGAAGKGFTKTLQTGGHTINTSTAKQLGLTREQANRAIHALKSAEGIPHNGHYKIMGNGDIVNPHTGVNHGSLYNYLP